MGAGCSCRCKCCCDEDAVVATPVDDVAVTSRGGTRSGRRRGVGGAAVNNASSANPARLNGTQRETDPSPGGRRAAPDPITTPLPRSPSDNVNDMLPNAGRRGDWGPTMEAPAFLSVVPALSTQRAPSLQRTPTHPPAEAAQSPETLDRAPAADAPTQPIVPAEAAASVVSPSLVDGVALSLRLSTAADALDTIALVEDDPADVDAIGRNACTEQPMELSEAAVAQGCRAAVVASAQQQGCTVEALPCASKGALEAGTAAVVQESGVSTGATVHHVPPSPIVSPAYSVQPASLNGVVALDESTTPLGSAERVSRRSSTSSSSATTAQCLVQRSVSLQPSSDPTPSASHIVLPIVSPLRGDGFVTATFLHPDGSTSTTYPPQLRSESTDVGRSSLVATSPNPLRSPPLPP